MQQKQLEIIADIIAGLQVSDLERAVIIKAFANRLLKENPRFKPQLFIAVCLGQRTTKATGGK